MKKYAEIRNKYENQRDDDYDDMLFDAWMRNQHLENATSPVKITWQRGIVVIVRRAVRYGFLIILALFPVSALLFGHSVEQTSFRSNGNPSVVITHGR